MSDGMEMRQAMECHLEPGGRRVASRPSPTLAPDRFHDEISAFHRTHLSLFGLSAKTAEARERFDRLLGEYLQIIDPRLGYAEVCKKMQMALENAHAAVVSPSLIPPPKQKPRSKEEEDTDALDRQLREAKRALACQRVDEKASDEWVQNLRAKYMRKILEGRWRDFYTQTEFERDIASGIRKLIRSIGRA